MRGLVLPGVPVALHPDTEKVPLPTHPAQHHRHGGHLALLHHAHSGLAVHAREAGRLGQQLPGEGRACSAGAPGIADLLRDAAGPSLAGPADTGADGAPLHTRVRPAPPLPLRGHGTLCPPGLLGGERDG